MAELLRPEGLKFKATGRELGRGSELPPTSLRGIGEHCKLPQQGSGWSPNRKYILHTFVIISYIADLI